MQSPFEQGTERPVQSFCPLWKTDRSLGTRALSFLGILKCERDVAETAIFAMRLHPESKFSAHFQHDRVLVENLTLYAFKSFCICVFNDHLHQIPAQSAALESRSEQDCKLTGGPRLVTVKPYDAECIPTGFIYGDKGNCPRIIELCQPGDELRRKLLDGIEEAKPQIFLVDMD